MTYKRFENYSVFTAADAQILIDQGIIPVANAAERNQLVTDGYAFVGMHVYRADTARLERYSGPILGWTAADGMLLLKRTLVTGQTSVVADGVFSDLFKRYRITAHLRASGAVSLNMNLRSGGTTDSAAGAYGNSRIWLATASTVSGSYGASSAWTYMAIPGTELDLSFELQGMRDSAEQTQGSGTGSSRGGSVGNAAVLWSGHIGKTDNFDGLVIASGSAATLTGEMCIYGLI